MRLPIDLPIYIYIYMVFMGFYGGLMGSNGILEDLLSGKKS